MLFVCLTLSHFGYTQNDDRGYIVKWVIKHPTLLSLYGRNPEKSYPISAVKSSCYNLQPVGAEYAVKKCLSSKRHLAETQNNPHFALIGIDLKENREQTIQFGKDLKITYPLTLDPKVKPFTPLLPREPESPKISLSINKAR